MVYRGAGLCLLLSLTAGCGGTGASTPAPTPTPDFSSGIMAATQQLKQLQSYHYRVTFGGNDEMTAIMSSTELSGDFVAPDQALVRTQASMLADAAAVELRSGGQIYVPNLDGTWTANPRGSSGRPGFNTTVEPDFIRNHMTVVLDSAGSWTDQGPDTVMVTSTTQLTPVPVMVERLHYTVDPARWNAGGGADRLGTVPGGAVWLDTRTNQVYKMSIEIQIPTSYDSLDATAASVLGLTPTPDIATRPPPPVVTALIELTRQNDSTLTVPTP
jgi:hypothetical protein